MIDACYAAARSVHVAACLVIFAVCVFSCFVAAGTAAWKGSRRRLLPIAWLTALLSGAAWFALVAINMSGLPARQALTADVLGVVWNQTHFGSLWKIRLILWAIVAIALMMPFWSRWLTLIVSSLLVASLAWSGHGQTSGDGSHLAADAVHLLIAGCWPTSLLPFLLFLFKFRHDRAAIAAVTNRFSIMSLASVVLLAASGVVNSYFLLGSVSRLFTTKYGLVLSVKIALFGAMVALGAVNLLWLKPRLVAEESAAALLRRNVIAELVLAAMVLIVLGILGILPPGSRCG